MWYPSRVCICSKNYRRSVVTRHKALHVFLLEVICQLYHAIPLTEAVVLSRQYQRVSYSFPLSVLHLSVSAIVISPHALRI